MGVAVQKLEHLSARCTNSVFFSTAAKEIFPKAAEKIGYTKALSVSLAVSNKKAQLPENGRFYVWPQSSATLTLYFLLSAQRGCVA
jgi:hypothetical protein